MSVILSDLVSAHQQVVRERILACRRFTIKFTDEPGIGKGVMLVRFLAPYLSALPCPDCIGFALQLCMLEACVHIIL